MRTTLVAGRAMVEGAAITVEGLRHTFRRADAGGRLSVLDGLDLHVPPGAHVAVVGPSGSGKSTLLSVLGGLEPPQEGTVRVGDTDLARLGGDQLAAYRRETVGFVFQHFGLLEALTAAENVEMALTLVGMNRSRRRPFALELLEEVGLAERAGHRPGALSGGERQRVAIARALASSPRLLLADEPTGNLDEENAVRVEELLERVRRDRGCTLVVVTHNQSLAARADDVLRLVDGRLEPSGGHRAVIPPPPATTHRSGPGTAAGGAGAPAVAEEDGVGAPSGRSGTDGVGAPSGRTA